MSNLFCMEENTKKAGRTVYESGYCDSPDFPYLATSPDGSIDDDTLIVGKCIYVAGTVLFKTIPILNSLEIYFT